MTIEEIDIAQMFNVPCTLITNDIENNTAYKITHLIRFWDKKMKCWKLTVNLHIWDWPNSSFTTTPDKLKPFKGHEARIAEGLKMLEQKDIYEKYKDKLMCRKGLK